MRVYRTRRPSHYGFRYVEWFHGRLTATVHCRSVIDGSYHQFQMPVKRVRRIKEWEVSNKSLQELFPEFTPEQHEMMLTGITDEQWGAEKGNK